MKKCLFALLACILVSGAHAQWSGPTNGWLSTSTPVLITQTGGATGMPGTVFKPLLSLSLTGFPTSGFGSVPGGTLYPLHVSYEGRVGIGTNAPAVGLHVFNNQFLLSRANGTPAVSFNPTGSFTFTTDGTNSSARGLFINNGANNFFSVTPQSILFTDGNAELFKVNNTGYVYARKMIVTLASPFPDFVFEKNYRLMPLTDLAGFINQYKHLPDMPAAAEVAANNNQIEVGEMQAKLLQKVEELTLYILQQQQQIDELKSKLAKQ